MLLGPYATLQIQLRQLKVGPTSVPTWPLSHSRRLAGAGEAGPLHLRPRYGDRAYHKKSSPEIANTDLQPQTDKPHKLRLALSCWASRHRIEHEEVDGDGGAGRILEALPGSA